MRRRVVFVSLQALFAAATVSFVAGCSGIGPTAVAPNPGARLSAMDRMERIKLSGNVTHRFLSYDACPSTGPIVYASDGTNNVINIYSGTFAGQAPCGQIASPLFNVPYGMFVKLGTHDLYVASGASVLVFHRGRTTPYNTYTDPSGQVPNDVTVANDGTVIVANLGQNFGPEAGSISTWIAGRNGGTFVGNFPMTNDIQGGFITVQRNGTVYYDDQDSTTRHGAVWSLSCPAGNCGAQTRLAGVSLGEPGGLGSDAHDDLLVTDSQPGMAETFELPDPNPQAFPVAGIVFGMAMDQKDQHWFVADALNNDAAEYAYPSGNLIGTVPGNFGGNLDGIAIDPGHAL
jgi:hypothetical protein